MLTDDQILASLNEVQQQVVTHTDNHILVLAGAGSGKTRAVTHKIAWLLKNSGLLPFQILAVTFTNKASGEMKNRLEKLVGPVTSGLEMGTFHSVCARILRRHATELGFTSKFTIYDTDDAVVLLRQVGKDLGLDTKREYPPKKVYSSLEYMRSKGISLEEWGKTNGRTEWKRSVVSILKMYDRRKHELDAMDFGDLLHRTVDLLRDHDDVREGYQRQFRYVLVDEMQDTNKVQFELLRLLAGEDAKVCAVGDDDQSIYGWRGARVENMLEFERYFPGAEVIRMEQNYRSTPVILKAAHAIIQNNQKRHDKKLWTRETGGEPLRIFQADSEGDEAVRVARKLQHYCSTMNVSFRDVAVFFRTNAQSRSFEEIFTRSGIPHVVVGGTRFYSRAEVKDLLAYLRTIHNPLDEVSLLRIVNNPPRGIGDKAIERLRALQHPDTKPLFQVLAECIAMEKPTRWQKAAGEFASMVLHWKERVETLSLSELAAEVMKESGYASRLLTLDPVEAESRQDNLNQLLAGMVEYEIRAEDPSLDDYLEQLALITDLDLWNDDQDRVPLMTVHAAKGLEFDTVFITGCEEGLFPHRNHVESGDIEEERRLFYVAVTRACKRLVFTYAGSRFIMGQQQYAVPSRFLKELGEDTVERKEAARRRSFTDAMGGGQQRFRKPAAQAPEATGGVAIKQVPISAAFAGKRVRHERFGDGKVLGVMGTGANAQVMVRFDSLKIETLTARELRVVE